MADVDEVASLRGHVALCKVRHDRDYSDLVDSIDRLAEAVQTVSLASEKQALEMAQFGRRLLMIEVTGIGIVLLQLAIMLF
jgi:hypothetical protein